jgi:hypothetical protein
MEITNKTKPEDIQKFIKKHRLTEAFECAGFLFRVKAHAESHSKKNKDAEIKTHVKQEETKEAKLKA